MEDAASQRASDFYLALCALDPEDRPVERRELIAAGISPESARSLYPFSLEAIALPLIDHLQQTGIDHLRGESGECHRHNGEFEAANKRWPLALRKTWVSQHASRQPYTESVWEIIYFLRDQIPARAVDHEGERPEGNPWYSFPFLLWNAWWLADRRATLPTEVQAHADAEVLWLADHMLPNLRLATFS